MSVAINQVFVVHCHACFQTSSGFHTTMAGLSSSNRDCTWPTKLKIFILWPIMEFAASWSLGHEPKTRTEPESAPACFMCSPCNKRNNHVTIMSFIPLQYRWGNQQAFILSGLPFSCLENGTNTCICFVGVARTRCSKIT